MLWRAAVLRFSYDNGRERTRDGTERRAETTHAVYTYRVHAHARTWHPRNAATPSRFFHPDAADVLIVIYRDIGEKSVGPRGRGILDDFN